MSCLGKLVLIGILFLLVLLGSCYKPYQYGEYVVIDGPSASYMGERTHEYQNYSADGNVVMVAFAGESDGDAVFVQHGPYEVYLAVWRERQVEKSPVVSIESLSVQEQKGVESAVVSTNAPVVLSFEKQNDELEVAPVTFEKRLDLQPKNGQRLFVTVVIKVDHGDSCTRKPLNMSFFRVSQKGGSGLG